MRGPHLSPSLAWMYVRWLARGLCCLLSVRLATVLWSRQGPCKRCRCVSVSVEMWRTWWRGEVERPPLPSLVARLSFSSIVSVHQVPICQTNTNAGPANCRAGQHSPRSSPHMATSHLSPRGVGRSNNTGITSNASTRSYCLPRKKLHLQAKTSPWCWRVVGCSD